jgi:hypothetical protein
MQLDARHGSQFPEEINLRTSLRRRPQEAMTLLDVPTEHDDSGATNVRNWSAASASARPLSRAIRADKIKNKQPPLVLRYWGEHYSAFLHCRAPVKPETQPSQDEASKGNARLNSDELSQQRTANSSSQEASQEAWDPTTWSGDVNELRRKLEGMTIPHDLQCEISVILERAEPQRYAQLLAFLVNTATQLSLQERDDLIQADVTDETSDAVRLLHQKYQLPITTMSQWQEEMVREHQEEEALQVSQSSSQAAVSDSSYAPTSSDSSQSTQENAQADRRITRGQAAAGKRQHTFTPIESEHIRLVMKSKLEHQVKPSAQDSRDLQDGASPMQIDQQGARAVWPNLWSKMIAL